MINQNIQVKESEEFLQKPQILEEIDFYQKGYEQLDVSQKDIQKIGRFMYTLTSIRIELSKSTQKKCVNNDYDRHLQGAIFAFGAEEKNKEWKEQSASSIREMISFNEGKSFADCVEEYCNRSKIGNFDSCSGLCDKINKYYLYFTSITHHQPQHIPYRVRALDPSNTQLDYKDCQSDEVYKKNFKQFFLDLKKILDLIEYAAT